jgi:FlaA1/EpsC-like NDP-sugar epimerase
VTGVMPSRSDLARLVAQRSDSMFAPDVAQSADGIAEAIEGRRVLVIGGAGSIGSATVGEIARYKPHQLHVVDVDENGLTELVRDLRSRGVPDSRTELRTTPLDFGGPVMRRLLEESGGYDVVLNFAAVKHVRSEKDVYSLLRMLEINVLYARRLLGWLADRGVPRYFAVSTDKAANPVNLMGATKRAMELVMLDQRVPQVVTSARFANVAFSNGSLLDGWLRRLEKRQPWATPSATRRYFVTPEESGQLCLLAATRARDRRIVIPALNPERHLRDLFEVAQEVLDALGLTPIICDTEEQARSEMQRVGDSRRWPLLVTPLDTAGEKEFEEFAGTDDVVHDEGFRQVRTLSTSIPDASKIDELLARTAGFLQAGDRVTSRDIIDCVRGVVPGLAHRESDKSLDARM